MRLEKPLVFFRSKLIAPIGVQNNRAVFHFLMQPEERRRYVETVRHAVRSDGHVIVATFALEGPTRWGGLNVVRYSPASLPMSSELNLNW